LQPLFTVIATPAKAGGGNLTGLPACTRYSKLKEHKGDEMRLVRSQKGLTLIEAKI